MGRAVKIAGVAVLGGLLMTLALVSANSPPVPGASAARASGAGALSGAGAVPRRCRTIVSPDPECSAAWEARRRRFFGQQDDET